MLKRHFRHAALEGWSSASHVADMGAGWFACRRCRSEMPCWRMGEAGQMTKRGKCGTSAQPGSCMRTAPQGGRRGKPARVNPARTHLALPGTIEIRGATISKWSFTELEHLTSAIGIR